MQPIRLYQIPHSHYCDKVRWALDFYPIPYQTITYFVQRTSGLEKAPRTLQKLTPIIEDPNNESLFISDSTPILIYLDKHYANKKTLFPSNTTDEKDQIIQYCLKLDSQLGLYARRLAYLYVISEKPAMLSVIIDGKYDKILFDDWKSYFLGILGSCFIIGRIGLHRIREENIFEKTVCLLEEIKENLDREEYLFNNQFTAADLTLTSLIQPLKHVPPLFIKYKSIFEHCDRIRERHDPKEFQESNVERSFRLYRQQKQSKSIIKIIFWKILIILFYPLEIFVNMNQKEKPLLEYPSINIQEKANNDVRILKVNSIINISWFLIKNFDHFCFTIPKQMEFVKNQGNKICSETFANDNH
jgi:glutathione S-transferase